MASHFKTKAVLVLTVLTVASVSSARLQAFEASVTPIRECADAGMQSRGFDPAMQNRWNPNTFAGKVHVEVVRECNQKLSAVADEEIAVDEEFYEEEAAVAN